MLVAQRVTALALAILVVIPAIAAAQASITGIVTDESGDKVTMRNIAAQEFTYKKSDITQRDHIPGSIMPPGLVNNLTIEEFASLLDYLESLSKK